MPSTSVWLCRCMGFLIRFIHNRDLTAENVITAFMWQQFVLYAPPESLQSLHAKLERAGLTLPVRSLLNTTKAVLEAKDSASGEFVVDVPRRITASICLTPPSTPRTCQIPHVCSSVSSAWADPTCQVPHCWIKPSASMVALTGLETTVSSRYMCDGANRPGQVRRNSVGLE